MNLEHPQAIDRLTIMIVDRLKMNMSQYKDCPHCTIPYINGSEIAELSCGYVAHVDCLGPILSEVI